MKDYARQMISNQGRPMTSVYETTEVQEFMLGTLFKTNEGDVFRYAKAGAAELGPGLLTQGIAPVAHHTNIATGVVVAQGATEFTYDTTLATTTTEDQYRDGWLLINDEAGEGHVYRIKSNTGSTEPKIELWDPIAVALTAASEVSLVSNPFLGSIVVPHSGITAANNGCPMVTVPANYFYWSKVRGPAAVSTVGTIIDGDRVINAQGTTNGGVQAAGNDDSQEYCVGHVMSVLATTDYSLINLTIE